MSATLLPTGFFMRCISVGFAFHDSVIASFVTKPLD